MSLQRPTCLHCVFWDKDAANPLATIGRCRRRPPGIAYNSKSATMIQRFPITGRNDWCGEWCGDETRLDEAKHEINPNVAEPVTHEEAAV